ncbi:MAG: NAD-dependent epimerase/dehydratase family protein, partial [Bacteroidota bacterium]|nr:NAD-dependent epimerase/dehydratase family protein [Bacteroidota bacterium]
IIVGIGNDDHKATIRLFKRIASKKLPFYTTGTNGFIDVEDVARICIQLMNSNIQSGRFIAINENISFKNYFEKIAEVLKVPPPAFALNSFGGRLMVTADWMLSKLAKRKRGLTKENLKVSLDKFEYSNKKLKEALGYNFIPFDETIRKAANSMLPENSLIIPG